mgnify:FL=1|tara:strand:- start:280 stop:999 length:720 start_codon:yes stop_codon:yes gene_type:complete
MIKLRNTLVAAIAIATLTISSVLAGSFGVGISLKSMSVDSSGTETDGTSTGASATDASVRTKSLSETANVGSYYLEYSTEAASWASEGNGWTIGFESMPGKANLSGKTLSRVDTSEGAGAAGDASGVSTFSAQAQIDNHSNIYVEIPLYSMLYIKAGQSSLDVISDETVSTNHGTYGNASVDGLNYGIGVKGMIGSNIKWKAAFEETDYDTLTIKSSTNNQIKADLDTSEFNISLGYQF